MNKSLCAKPKTNARETDCKRQERFVMQIRILKIIPKYNETKGSGAKFNIENAIVEKAKFFLLFLSSASRALHDVIVCDEFMSFDGQGR